MVAAKSESWLFHFEEGVLSGKTVKEWSETFTNGKMIFILEGGYELSVPGESVAAYVDGLFIK